MKKNIKYLGICLLTIIVGVMFNRCEDDQVAGSINESNLGRKPVVTTKDVTNVTSSSATCGGNVISDGDLTVTARGVCWNTSGNPTISDSHTFDDGGTGSFYSSLTGLTNRTTYYVRAYATNSKGTNYGAQKSFTTGQYSKWLVYDNGTYKSSWGFTNGGNIEWAVMFPSYMLSQYDGISVCKVRAYFTMTGSYTLRIYEGNTSTTSTTLYSKNISISSTGWNETSVPYVPLTNNKSLWVSLSKSHQSGEYPCCVAAGTDNLNARWYRSSSTGTWKDWFDNDGGVDITWMIRASISYYSNKSGKMEEMELPQTQNMDNSSINPETRRSM